MQTNEIIDLPPQIAATTNLSEEELRQRKRILIGLSIALVVIFLILIAFLLFLLSPNTDPDTVSRIRDVFIIVMALESLIIGLILVLLIYQLTRLINMINNEVKPILESTNETLNTMRGTSAFLSENVVEPVIKINEYVAILKKTVDILGFGKKQ
jgi:hypothetical protein